MKRKAVLIVTVLVVLSLMLGACAAYAGNPKIRVATEAAYPPFEMVRESDKQLEGFDIDLMNAIAEKAGFEVEYVNTPFDSVLAGISTCQFDAAISAITITAERAEKIGFSDPYINAGQITTVQIGNTEIKGPAELVGKTIGVQLSTTGQIEAEKIEGATIKPYDTVDLAFLDLANGQVDAVVADYPTTLNYVNKMKDKLKLTGDVFTEESYGIGVCKKNTDLLNKINKALGELKQDGTLKKLEEKWLVVEFAPNNQVSLESVPTEQPIASVPDYEIYKTEINQIKGDLGILQEKVNMLPNSPTEGEVDEIRNGIDSISNRLSNLENVINTTPEKALSLTLLKGDFENLKQGYQTEIESLRRELQGVREVLNFLIIILVTINLALLAPSILGLYDKIRSTKPPKGKTQK